MFMFVTSVLADYWEHGEDIRKWYENRHRVSSKEEIFTEQENYVQQPDENVETEDFNDNSEDEEDDLEM